MLYPEDPHNLKRVKDRPEHKFFKRFGESMPEGDWNHPGTKQGLYMIGPDGEYLEGKFAASGFPTDIKQRMRRALDRWQKLRRDKKYANKPVPKVVSTLPPRVDGKEFVLRVHSRDLPRGDQRSGLRFDPIADRASGWRGFTHWAWNENWLAVDNWRVLVPAGKKEQDVDEKFVQTLARQMLIDNVRGQANTWPKGAIREARLTMHGERGYGGTKIVYRGEVDLVDGERAIKLQMHGQGHYDNEHDELKGFRLVALGTRKGAHRFNQRSGDLGPAPIGFAISRYRAPEEPQDPEAKTRTGHRPPRTGGPAGPTAPAPGGPVKTVVEGPGWPVRVVDEARARPLVRLAKRIDDRDYGFIDRVLVAHDGAILFDQAWTHDYAQIGAGKSMQIGWGVAGKQGTMPPDYNYLDATRHPFRAGSELHSLQSVTKSVMSLLVGIAIQKGYLKGVAQPIQPMLMDFVPKQLDTRFASVRLEDLLTMRVGLEWHEWNVPAGQENTTLRLEGSGDWMRFIMAQPMDADPGKKWQYNSGTSHLLSAILHEATGVPVDTFAARHLFAPLGIRSHHWKKDPQGYPDGEGGLYLRAHDLLRIGELVLRKGQWGSQRILTRAWLEKSVIRYAEIPGGRGYGYQWWRIDQHNHKIIAALGFGGQMLIVVPGLNVVAVVNGWNVFEGKRRALQKDFVSALIRLGENG